MKHRLYGLAALCALTATGETIQERGKRVVDEAVQALGGEKFLAVKDRVETGRAYSFYRDELKGLSVATVYTRYLDKAPAGALAQRERQAFGKDEYSSVLFTDGKGYEITFRGARPLPEETLSRYDETTRRNIFYILRNRLKEPGMILESKGMEIENNRPVEIVEITDADNDTVAVSFDRSTKLPLRQVFYRRNPQTRERMEEVTIFSKYRDVGDGVMWPYAIERKRNGDKIFEMYSDSVAINQNLTDDKFTVPTDMKILPKPK
jgi:hypothetical protein